MNSSWKIERKSPILNNLTRQRTPSPGRNPSKTFLKNSFNEHDKPSHDRPYLSGSTIMSNKPGPPPTLKKPEIPRKPPEVAKKPIIAKPSANGNAFRENLNKKLSIPLPGKYLQEKPTNVPNKISNGNVSAIKKDLENVFASNHLRDNPKSDRTVSLTEVSTLHTEDKSNKRNINDTLDMMTDEGFDTTGDDNLLDNIGMHGDIELSSDEDDDELFANFSIPPPPPPAVDFSDSEWDESVQDKVRTDIQIPEESLSCTFEMFVPPPPPADLMHDTDENVTEENASDIGDFDDIEVPDFGDSSNEDNSVDFGTIERKPIAKDLPLNAKYDLPKPVTSPITSPFTTNKTIGLVSSTRDGIPNVGSLVQKDINEKKPKLGMKIPIANPEDSDSDNHGKSQDKPITGRNKELASPVTVKPLTLPVIKPDIKQNLLVGELKGKLNLEHHKADPNRDSPVNSFSRNIDNSPNIPRKDFFVAPKQKVETENKPKILFNQIGNELKSKNDSVLKEMGQVNLKPVKKASITTNELDESVQNKFDSSSTQFSIGNIGKISSKPPIEVDSGHCTARSVEISDSEKNAGGSLPNSSSMSRKVLKKTISKTWSSYSSGIDDTEPVSEEDDDETEAFGEESEIQKPKVNLRDLLKKMKSFESDTDDETFDFKSGAGSQNDTVIRNGANTDFDDDDSVHLTDSDVETHLNDLEVSQWSCSDVIEWLNLIGLSHLKDIFLKHKIDGVALSGLDMSLLDQMRITSHDDRELILSEVYALQNTGDVDQHVSMLDHLDKASGEEKEKMITFLNALQSPSHLDDINGYMLSTERQQPTMGLQASTRKVVQEDFLTATVETGVHADNPTTNNFQANGNINKPIKKNEEDKALEMMKKLAEDVFDPTNDTDDMPSPSHSAISSEKSPSKKTKKKGFFASLRKGKGKKSKANQQQDDTSDESIVGTIRVAYSSKQNNKETIIPVFASMKTTSKQVGKMCLDHLDLHEDVNCYRIAISRFDKKIENVELNPDECPLAFQTKWTDMSTYRFELKSKIDGYIVINNEENNSGDGDQSTIKLGVSNNTRVVDILPILGKKFMVADKPNMLRLKSHNQDDYLNDSCVVLSLPLVEGYKFHLFKLVNVSPKAMQNKNEMKKLQTKCELLEKQVQVLNVQIEEQKSKESLLRSQNETLNESVSKKNEEIKLLQHELTNLNLTEKTRKLVSPSQEKELQLSNSNLTEELQKTKYQATHLEQINKTLREEKLDAQKKKDQLAEQNKILTQSIEELKNKLDYLQSEKKNKTNDSSGQVKKLYTENKELLRTVQTLEERLSDTEYKYSQLQQEQETDGVENSELRMREEALENQILEKDSKILEMEYKIQRKDRTIREMEDHIEEEGRKRKKETDAKENAERRSEDLLLKLENNKQQLNEKEKHIQAARTQLNKSEKKLTKQRTIMEQEKHAQNEEIQTIRLKMESEISVLQEKIESLTKLNVEKNHNQKQKEFELTKKNEDFQVLIGDLERKLSSKDVLIERLENKVAQVDLNVETKLEEQMELTQIKEDKIHELEMEIARLESEHSSKLRESTNTLRNKESTVSKLEAKIKKLEANNRDGAKKFEKFSTEKDRLLLQLNDDRDKELKDLKRRLRSEEEKINERENQVKEVKRKSSEMKKSYETKLKKREKEYKQQKYLLEKILELVNEKSPSLLRQLQDEIDFDQNNSSSGRSSRRSNNSTRMEEDSIDEWC